LSWGLSHYRHPDWPGSERLESGTARNIIQDIAYAPFGEPYAQNTGGNGELSFTGQNKDTDWLNYDFMYREFDPRQGRWISPDPAGQDSTDPSDPQSWNRYAYVSNDPLIATDPNGLVGCNADACVTAPFPDDIILLDVPFGWNFNTAVQQLQNGLRDLTTAVWHWASAPRNPGCVATLTTAGAAGGAALGAKAGFGGGLVLGGIGGTAVEPGGGTLVGGWAGGVEGAAGGAIAGGTLGAIGGKAAGYALCATGSGGSGGGESGGDWERALQKWKRVPADQKALLQRWIGAVKGSGGTAGPVPPGLTRETLESYRDLAQAAGNVGRDGVGTQAARVLVINEALQNMP
jgi:RHS repeat-associated protein